MQSLNKNWADVFIIFPKWMVSAAVLMLTHITSSDIRLVSHLHARLEPLLGVECMELQC